MNKIVIVVVASLALATLACNALGPAATAVPIFVPEATEDLPPTASLEPSPTPTPLRVEVLRVAVYKSWEDQDQKYETPAGYAWLAVEVRVLSGDPDEAVDSWEADGNFPAVVSGEGFGLSDAVIVYFVEDQGMLMVFRVPSDAPVEGLLLLMPDGQSYPLEEFFQPVDPPQFGSQA